MDGCGQDSVAKPSAVVLRWSPFMRIAPPNDQVVYVSAVTVD